MYHPFLSNFLSFAGLASLDEAGLRCSRAEYERLTSGDVERWNAWRRAHADHPIWLSGCDLRGLDLTGADLRDAHLELANLYKAELKNVDLRGARLMIAYLSGAVVAGADLENADLRSIRARALVLDERTHIWHCLLDRMTDLSGTPLGLARIEPKLRRQIESNIDAIDEDDWRRPGRAASAPGQAPQLRSAGATSAKPLRILHLSDLHERAAPLQSEHRLRWDATQRGQVLGPGFLEAVRELAAGGIDLVCFTGDLADWGHPSEYEKATARIDAILTAAGGVPRDRFFAVPGNHDVQRFVREDVWRGLRTWTARTHDRSPLGRWLHRVEGPPIGLQDAWREQILERTAEFWSWLDSFRGAPLRPKGAVPLGYRATLQPGEIAHVSEPVHVVGLDSAWLCGADGPVNGGVLVDRGQILLTDEQVEAHVRDGEHALSGLRICLVHHPLDHLADQRAVRRLLGDGAVDLLLHGHQHDPGITFADEPGAALRIIAAGCLIEGDLGKGWPNGFHVIEIDPATRAGALHLRKWSKDGGFWAKATDIYRNAPDGVLRWTPAGFDRLRSDEHVTTNRPGGSDGSTAAVVKLDAEGEMSTASDRGVDVDGRVTLLFLCANEETSTEKATEASRFGRESQQIQESLSSAILRDSFLFRSAWSVTRRHFLSSLNDHRPQLVHFCGHGSVPGIALKDERGDQSDLDSKSMSTLFATVSHHVSCVLLNACDSAGHAEVLSEHITAAIGMRGTINDHAGLVFSATFYRSLASGLSVEHAYKQGLAMMVVEKTDDLDAPQLYSPKADPTQLVFVKRQATPRHGRRLTIKLTADPSGATAKLVGQILGELIVQSQDTTLEIIKSTPGSLILEVATSVIGARNLLTRHIDGTLRHSAA